MSISFPRGKLRESELNARLDNCADSLPWPQPSELDHVGTTFKDPAANQGRGPTPTQWRVIDALICSIFFAVLYWILTEATS